MTVKPIRSIYQLKIVLKNAKPPIWRRLLVPSNIQLDTLHTAIQISMGWTDSHLHQFITKDQEFYSTKEDDLGFDVKDESKFNLSQLLTAEKDNLIYEYDFGDSWIHTITLEKVLPFDTKKKLPYCVTGKRACPPEDCGGIWGYKDLLAILENPEHEDYEEMRDWLKGDFDPSYLSRREINQLLIEYCH